MASCTSRSTNDSDPEPHGDNNILDEVFGLNPTSFSLPIENSTNNCDEASPPQADVNGEQVLKEKGVEVLSMNDPPIKNSANSDATPAQRAERHGGKEGKKKVKFFHGQPLRSGTPRSIPHEQLEQVSDCRDVHYKRRMNVFRLKNSELEAIPWVAYYSDMELSDSELP